METLHAERRATETRACTDRAAGDPATAVRQAILLQACVGTAGAVEYLKAHQLKGEVISRVLSGGSVREGDRAAPDGIQYRPS